MSNNGYSDRINHALAFAAKHHDQQVRRGTRLPYATHSANVAIILTRYGKDDDCVIAGILHNVVTDYLSDGFSRERLEERVTEKFGELAVDTLLAITERRYDGDGVELSHEERKADLLHRIASASESSRWVCAADKLHLCGSLLTDLRRTEFRETVWGQQQAGRTNTIGWYKSVHERLQGAGFKALIMQELRDAISELDRIPE